MVRVVEQIEAWKQSRPVKENYATSFTAATVQERERLSQIEDVC